MMAIHPYERRWIQFSLALLVIFGLAVAGSTLLFGIHLPGTGHHPLAEAAAAGYDPEEAWIREIGPGHYEVNLHAHAFYFDPGQIEIPAGATVTFNVHSADVIHGFKIIDTNVSLMAIPGQVARVTHTFAQPGEYLFVCTEYCGTGHHVMHGKVLVKSS